MAYAVESWRVATDEFTNFVAPEFDGSSEHPIVQQQTFTESLNEVPDDFAIGVIFGPSGSGKTKLLRALAEKIHASKATVADDQTPPQKSGANVLTPCDGNERKYHSDRAVCSHASFISPEGKSEAVSRLSCVGLNRIPAWLRPFKMLSNGEASRVELALALRSEALLDDFAAVVDETTACSMACSLARFVRRHALRRVLVATAKASCLPFLCADFVVVAQSGQVVLNTTEPGACRQPMISFDLRGLGKFSRTAGSPAGWKEGELDEGKVQRDWASELVGANVKVFADVGEKRELQCKVQNDASCQEAANAFEFSFSGETVSVFNILPRSAALTPPVQGSCLGAVLGRSGCGKSTTLAAWGELSPLSWERGISVISHFLRLGMMPEKAAEVLEAVQLPRRCWLCPFGVLSAGEQQRAEIARRLPFGGPVDEFTSVLDRRTAQQVCQGVAGYVRRYKDRFAGNPVVVATVHEDIARWLCPDWIWDAERSLLVGCEWSSQDQGCREIAQPSSLDKDAMARLLERPKLDFHVRRLTGSFFHVKEIWKASFAPHHYLTGSLPTCVFPLIVRSADGAPVAFYASSVLPGMWSEGITFREARMVILPEFQGLGLGPRLSDTIAQKWLDEGLRYFSVTAHPSLGERRQSSDLWRAVDGNMEAKKSGIWRQRQRSKRSSEGSKKERVCYRHQYMGPEGHGNDHLLDSWEWRCKERQARQHGCAECAVAVRVSEHVVQEGNGSLPPSALIAKFAEDGVDLAFLERHFNACVVIPKAQRVDGDGDSPVQCESEQVQDAAGEGSVALESRGKCVECAVALHVEEYLRRNGGSASLISLCSKFCKSVLKRQWPELTFSVEKNFLMRHFEVRDGQASVIGFVPPEEGAKVQAVVDTQVKKESYAILREQCLTQQPHVGKVDKKEPDEAVGKVPSAMREAARTYVQARRGRCTECTVVNKIRDFIFSHRDRGKAVPRARLEERFGAKHTSKDFLQRHFHVNKMHFVSIKWGGSRRCDECSLAIKVAAHLHAHSERSIAKICGTCECGCKLREAALQSNISASKSAEGFKNFLARWFRTDGERKTVELEEDDKDEPHVTKATFEVKWKADADLEVKLEADANSILEQACQKSAGSDELDQDLIDERPRKRRKEDSKAFWDHEEVSTDDN